MPHKRPVTIGVSDPLGPEEASRIMALLDGSDPTAAIALDVRCVSEFEDHLLVRIAQALASRGRAGSFIGLPQHEERILRYLGIRLGSK
jgi:hypothetical protein